MGKWLRSLLIIGTLTLFLGLIALIVAGYKFQWDWTGFTEHIGPKVPQYQPTKTLWDWFQLLGVLAIPAAVGLGTIWFTTKQAQVSEAENTDNQREAALQAYLDKMSELLLEKNLRSSSEDDEIRKIARVRTLTVLRQLDSSRKASVLQFLHESDLIRVNEFIIDLQGADLSEADLQGADLNSAYLSGVNLSGANLSRCDLRFTYLGEANLSKANLSGAKLVATDLRFATLTKANLSKALMLETDLVGADLRFANLREADLSKAKLDGGENDFRPYRSGADLSGAKLNGAIITSEQLKWVKSLQGATMSDGSKHL